MISKSKQAGMLSIDAAMTLLVLTVLITLASYWMIKQTDARDFKIAADKQITVAEALSKYLKDNYKTVLESATATAPAQITVAMLQNTNYLPDGFGDTNGFGQTIIGLARRPNPNQLEAIVLTIGGQAVSELGIRTIAENLGGPGGYISTVNPNVIQGVRGGWQVALSNYSVNPGAGHTASALFLMDGELANDYLYRNAVPGHPELNTMNTALNMGGQDINNAGEVTASTVSSTGTITATGRLSTNEYLSIGGLATEGAACTDNKLMAKNAAGLALSCQSGVWNTITSNMKGTYVVGTFNGGCRQNNPFTGSCSCPAGSGAYLSGQSFQYTQWDATILICYEVR